MSNAKTISALIALLTLHLAAWPGPSDTDHQMTTIHSIDLSQPDTPKGPGFILIIFDVKKLKSSGSRAHVIFRQFTKRVRLEFESAGIPRGAYKVGVADTCSPGTKNWTFVHEFKTTSTYHATEKSLPKYALREAKPGQLRLEGRKVGLFRFTGKKGLLIDCKAIQ